MSNKKQKSSNISFNFSKSLVIVYIILALILVACSYIFKPQIENYLNYNSFTDVIDYNGLVMHTIDVGQAEAIMIKLPDNKNLLIDAGDNNETSRTKLLNYLNNTYFPQNDNKFIDYFVITHSDADHVGGVKAVCDSFEILNIYRPKIYSSQNATDSNIETTYTKKAVSTKVYAEAIEAIYNENCNIIFSESGIEIIEESYTITFYAPIKDYYTNVNDFSPMIVVSYNNRTIMLTGDITSEAESEVLEKYTLSKIDILNVAHHGSKTSTSVEFLKAITPSYAVISCGDSSEYGHPHTQTLNRLHEYMNDNFIYTTFKNGNIVINIASDGNIGVMLDVTSLKTQIKVEYILIAVLIILFIAFFVKKKKTKST